MLDDLRRGRCAAPLTGEAAPGRPRGRRSYTEADRDAIRGRLIEAGRRMLARGGDMSMRQIAAEAGCSPAAIYQYFPDRRALLAAVRERDMNAATDAMEAAAHNVADARERVRAVFLTAARYWLAHPEHFDCLFSALPGDDVLRCADGTPFGRSASVQRSLALYTRTVECFLGTLAQPPLGTRKAVDVLIATTHGVIAFPRVTRSMQWSDTLEMVECAIDALLGHWSAQASAAARR